MYYIHPVDFMRNIIFGEGFRFLNLKRILYDVYRTAGARSQYLL